MRRVTHRRVSRACQVLRHSSLSYPLVFSFFFFFFFFFVIKSLLCLKVQKTHAALAMEIKKPINQKSSHPLHLIIGKIKPPETIEETSPAQHLRLAPQTRRETTHRNVQERDPNPSAVPQVTLRKESKKRLDTTTIANMLNPRTRTVKSSWGGGSTVGSDRKVAARRRLGETNLKEAVQYHDQP